MKKLLFGCFLMLSGIIGGTGWVLAWSIPYGWGDLSHLFFSMIFDGRIEGFCIIFFYIIAIIGTVIAVKALKEE